ncbi:MAG: branched-chain amino acid ABC transporter permease [Ardenticatenaceae bacterium]|nr:branched-chain amino acid ABC transporter permease [Anaerolineales bacterium]MCB8923579.1 branched-chain amino acid ABC transporter permease [Ardenticatenaceae bacterium]MCB9003519.1 branched-chain amino acid ABC transporter permease [Ardenticatenaceae bacterium]
MESGIFHTTYESDMALRRTPLMRWRIYLIVAVIVILPFFGNSYTLTLANQIGIVAIGAIGLNILTGFTGQISLGQGGFMAIGAYTSGVLAASLGVPWWLTIPIACVATAVVGTLFGIPSLRLKGLYLAIATLAAQQIIQWAIVRSPLGVDAVVVPPVTIFGTSLNKLRIGPFGGSDFWFYWIIYLFMFLTILFAVNLFRTKVGRAFIAIRDQDIAAEVMGVNLFRYKLLSFATSSFIVGLAGALLGQYRGIVNYERFTIETSIFYLAVIIIGGLGSVSGSVYGAVFMVIIPAILSNLGQAFSSSAPAIARLVPFAQQAVFGLTIILFLVLEPEGLAKIWRDIKDYFRLWPFSY